MLMSLLTIVTSLDKLRIRKMGNVSQNFNRSEFACKCGCGFSTVDVDLIKVLEVVRRRFGKPITINSACRCEDHNKNIGGSYGSKHKQGIAADIVVAETSPNEVYTFLDEYEPNRHGVGKYNNFTHIDVRQNKARWEG